MQGTWSAGGRTRLGHPNRQDCIPRSPHHAIESRRRRTDHSPCADRLPRTAGRSRIGWGVIRQKPNTKTQPVGPIARASSALSVRLRSCSGRQAKGPSTRVPGGADAGVLGVTRVGVCPGGLTSRRQRQHFRAEPRHSTRRTREKNRLRPWRPTRPRIDETSAARGLRASARARRAIDQRAPLADADTRRKTVGRGRRSVLAYDAATVARRVHPEIRTGGEFVVRLLRGKKVAHPSRRPAQKRSGIHQCPETQFVHSLAASADFSGRLGVCEGWLLSSIRLRVTQSDGDSIVRTAVVSLPSGIVSQRPNIQSSPGNYSSEGRNKSRVGPPVFLSAAPVRGARRTWTSRNRRVRSQ